MESQQSDESRMQRYREGDGEAFAELYKAYQARVFAYLRHKGLSLQASEEVFQNIWSKLHQTRFRYEMKFKFAAWLFTIARSVLIDFWRKEKKFSSYQNYEEGRHGQEIEMFQTAKAQIAWEQISEQDKKVWNGDI